MDIRFNIFISHDNSDETIAIELKKFIENIFLNTNVYVSGRDLEGGQTWIENIKLALKSSQVIIALVTKKSINANWLYFESGAGFTDDKTIPLISDNLQFKDLTPPLSLLQSRLFNKTGINQIITDISKKLNLREPTSLPGLDEMISAVASFIASRTENILQEKVEINTAQSKKVFIETVNLPDPAILHTFAELNKRAQNALIVKILSVADKYKIPAEEVLRKKSVSDLCDIASAYNIPTPGITNLRIMSASLGLPRENAEEWKKLNVLRGFEQANKELDKYEAK